MRFLIFAILAIFLIWALKSFVRASSKKIANRVRSIIVIVPIIIAAIFVFLGKFLFSLPFLILILPLLKIKDYFWHLCLPLVAMLIGSFAGLTFLTKNSFLDQINQQYVMTARAKGLTENKVLYGHVFRNSMLIVIAGFPATLNSVLFTGVLFIEIIFSLDGLGLLGYEAVINRDYPVIFSTLYFFSLLGLILGIISDVMYSIIDPRIDFETRDH